MDREKSHAARRTRAHVATNDSPWVRIIAKRTAGGREGGQIRRDSDGYKLARWLMYYSRRGGARCAPAVNDFILFAVRRVLMENKCRPVWPLL